MAPARRHRCIVCAKAKLEEEFYDVVIKTQPKGNWTCKECMPQSSDTHPLASKKVTPPYGPVPVADVVLEYLLEVDRYVEHQVPNCCWPEAPIDLPRVSIPNFEQLLSFAAALDSAQRPAVNCQMINFLLGRAANHDFGVPDPTKPLTFPADHYFHPAFGPEWYYLTAKVPVVNSAGVAGELSVVTSFQRTRSVGLTSQRRAGWTDHQVTLMSCVASAAVRFNDGKTPTTYVSGAPNTHWGATEPEMIDFTTSAGDPFRLRVGAGTKMASLVSRNVPKSTEVLPLVATLVEGTKIKMSLTFSTQPSVNKSQGWFLQGNPTPKGTGSGYTTAPTPGFYYSWPQLDVTATDSTVILDGVPFTITGPGTGWIDHQCMGTSLLNSAAPPYPVQPIPFLQDSSPVNGWTWEFCNFTSNRSMAWTSVAFVESNTALASEIINPYGYLVTLPANGIWQGMYTTGLTVQAPTVQVTAPAGYPTNTTLPFVSIVGVPNNRTFNESVFAQPAAANPVASLAAVGWNGTDGKTLGAAFNNPNYTMVVECPADWIDTSTGAPVGWGFLEAEGYEPVHATQNRLMHYLQSKTYPAD